METTATQTGLTPRTDNEIAQKIGELRSRTTANDTFFGAAIQHLEWARGKTYWEIRRMMIDAAREAGYGNGGKKDKEDDLDPVLRAKMCVALWALKIYEPKKFPD